MPKIIVASRYLKPTSQSTRGNLVQYIATRETVAVYSPKTKDAPSTDNQKQLIEELLKSYPDGKKLPEYDDYEKNSTKANASELISELIEQGGDQISDREILVKYVAERPGVEKIGKHGLFSDSDDEIVLSQAMKNISEHQGNVWSHVISLRREDAERLGYVTPEMWRDLVMRHTDDIAKAQNIDMLSFITLYPKGWQDHSFIAMNGVYESAVLNALENHKNLSDIYICTDNDVGGIEAADRLRDILRGKGYENILRILSENKDFNEDLKSRNGIEPLPAVPHRRKEIFAECVSPFRFEPFDITRTAECLMAYRKHNSYIAAADIALRTAAILIMREKNEPPAEIYEKLKEQLTKGYKSYADKGTAAAKDKCFGSSILAVKEKLKHFPAASEQRKETVDALMELADAAIRCETDKRLTEEQSMSDQDEQPRIRMPM